MATTKKAATPAPKKPAAPAKKPAAAAKAKETRALSDVAKERTTIDKQEAAKKQAPKAAAPKKAAPNKKVEKETRVLYTFRLEKSLVDKLVARGGKEGITHAAVARNAIAAYV